MSDEISDICKNIISEADPEKIILYGTKYDPSGDRLREANFCVVVRDNAKVLEKILYKRLDLDFPYNLLVYDAADWERLAADPTSYAASINRKGVSLYGKKKKQSP